MPYMKVSLPCLVGLCMAAALTMSAVGNASAKSLLFKTSSGFPFDLAGSGGLQIFELLNTLKVRAASVDALATLINATLFNENLTFLGVLQGEQFPCHSAGDAEGVILLNLRGHLGLAMPGDTPGVLLSLPSRFEFSCGLGGTWQIFGNDIGLITSPGILGVGTKSLGINFVQSGGLQLPTSFLLENLLLTNQALLTTMDNLTETLLPLGQMGSWTLLATTGTFTIVDE